MVDEIITIYFIAGYFSRKIHVVTAKGFELKITLFIFAYSMNFLVTT
jgi:hypothetical protein